MLSSLHRCDEHRLVQIECGASSIDSSGMRTQRLAAQTSSRWRWLQPACPDCRHLAPWHRARSDPAVEQSLARGFGLRACVREVKALVVQQEGTKGTIEPLAVVDGAVARAQEAVSGTESSVEGAIESIRRLGVRVDAVPVRLVIGFGRDARSVRSRHVVCK
jgi:hypothetical protein